MAVPKDRSFTMGFFSSVTNLVPFCNMTWYLCSTIVVEADPLLLKAPNSESITENNQVTNLPETVSNIGTNNLMEFAALRNSIVWQVFQPT